MGSTGSRSPDSRPSERKKEFISKKRLREVYTIGSTLGEGAFGVVAACTERSSGAQHAVKMVDKVETPLDKIMREAHILRSLSHPNVVKVHGVFAERCFVCIVMDKYDGGDLVSGLQLHLRERGLIPCDQIVHVSRQMAVSIQYLHSESIVHRDVKGDNYLMSRMDVTDPDCLIVLTDFGTAVRFAPEERLTTGVGTQLFWPPEFFKKNYGPKVDVWAMGVIMYGLLTGRFPFKDKHDIQHKKIKYPPDLHPRCQDFMLQILERDEGRRFSSEQAVAHPWMDHKAEPVTAAGEAKAEEDAEACTGAEFRESAANKGVKERRKELIRRLTKADLSLGQSDSAPTQRNHHLQPCFELKDKTGVGAKFAYEWWDPERVAQMGLLELEKSARPLQDIPDGESDLSNLQHMLEEHRIDLGLFGSGQAKTLPQLASEVHSGACRLMLDAQEHKKLVRCVEIVLLRIFSSSPADPEQHLIIETEECYADGRKRTGLRLPGAKREPYENIRQAAERTFREVTNLPEDLVTLNLANVVRYEEETESPSYPGVQTVYRKHIVDGTLHTEDAASLAKVGLPSFASWCAIDKEGITKTFTWMTEQMATEKGVKLKAEGDEVVSTLVHTPVGLNESELTKRLEELGIDVSKYGEKGKTISIKELSAQLTSGEATLLRGANGQALRMVDVVILIIKNPATGALLVQTLHEQLDGSKTALNRLPGNKCKPNENYFLTARRILKTQLEMTDDDFRLFQDVQFVEQEAASMEQRQMDLSYYGGLKTVYHKRLIKAELIQPGSLK